MAETRKIIFLAGAPEAAQLVWNESNLTQGLHIRFVDRGTGSSTDSVAHDEVEESTRLTQAPTKWRSTHNDNEITIAPVQGQQTTPPLWTRFLSFDGLGDGPSAEGRDKFLDHSMAFLEQLDSSQLALPEGEDSTFVSTTSFITNSDKTTSSPLPLGALDQVSSLQLPNSFAINLVDLKRIPGSDYLARIHPQTLTPSLLAAVISVSPSRTVSLRRQNAEMDIIELLLGDETSAGFMISFFVAPLDSQDRAVDDMRASLQQLRAGDVIAVQNIALNSFQGRVYGQGMNRRFARNSTIITVLPNVDSLNGVTKGKYHRVREWANNFIGLRVVVGNGSTGKQVVPETEVLPQDTQPTTRLW